MMQEQESRLDKFLWSVRFFKTRSLSTEACKKGRVEVNGTPSKASKTVSKGDEIRLSKPPVVYSYKILEIPKNRLSAKLIPDYILDLTPAEELQKLKMQDDFFIRREKGSGRPTKKDRRLIDKIRED